jgi:hypothetical protein
MRASAIVGHELLGDLLRERGGEAALGPAPTEPEAEAAILK